MDRIRNMAHTVWAAIEDLEHDWPADAVVDVLREALAASGLTNGELDRIHQEVLRERLW